MDEAAFLAALKRREPGPVATFFDEHNRRVQRTVSALLGPDVDATDVVHEVFVRALGSVRRFRGTRSQLGPWVAKIAVYTVRDLIRRRSAERRRRETVRPEFFPTLPSTAASAGVLDALRRAYIVMDKLPETERTPFILRHVEGMQLEDVAQSCGVSLATAKRRLRRARSRFETLAGTDPILKDFVSRGH